MTINVTPAGTRGVQQPRLPAPIMAGLSSIFTAIYRRFGSRMRVAGRSLLLLTTIGAKTGKERQSILGWWPEEGATDGSILIVGSVGGSARHPAWLLNMARHPDQVWIERDGRRTRVQPETLIGEERAAVWGMVAAGSAQYAGYQDKTDREIPVIRLRPLA